MSSTGKFPIAEENPADRAVSSRRNWRAFWIVLGMIGGTVLLTIAVIGGYVWSALKPLPPALLPATWTPGCPRLDTAWNMIPGSDDHWYPLAEPWIPLSNDTMGLLEREDDGGSDSRIRAGGPGGVSALSKSIERTEPIDCALVGDSVWLLETFEIVGSVQLYLDEFDTTTLLMGRQIDIRDWTQAPTETPSLVELSHGRLAVLIPDVAGGGKWEVRVVTPAENDVSDLVAINVPLFHPDFGIDPVSGELAAWDTGARCEAHFLIDPLTGVAHLVAGTAIPDQTTADAPPTSAATTAWSNGSPPTHGTHQWVGCDADVVLELEADLMDMNGMSTPPTHEIFAMARAGVTGDVRHMVGLPRMGETGWDGTPTNYTVARVHRLSDTTKPGTPLNSDLIDSINGSIDQGIYPFRLPDGRVLLTQVVLPTPTTINGGNGILRLGTLDPSANAISWAGYLDLPTMDNKTGLLDFPPSIWITPTAWLVGIQLTNSDGMVAEVESQPSWTVIKDPLGISVESPVRLQRLK
ncbi:MAG: hypothetical protein ABI743_11855 [bacterium]